METTFEQRMAVRRDECRMNGHGFSQVLVWGSLAPQLILCDRCGTSWHIRDEDTDKDFDSPDPASLPLAEKDG